MAQKLLKWDEPENDLYIEDFSGFFINHINAFAVYISVGFHF